MWLCFDKTKPISPSCGSSRQSNRNALRAHRLQAFSHVICFRLNLQAAMRPSRASPSSNSSDLNKTVARGSRIHYAIMRGNCIDTFLSRRAVSVHAGTHPARSDCASIITQSAWTTYTARTLFETNTTACIIYHMALTAPPDNKRE
jgi:hypothetical protein